MYKRITVVLSQTLIRNRNLKILKFKSLSTAPQYRNQVEKIVVQLVQDKHIGQERTLEISEKVEELLDLFSSSKNKLKAVLMSTPEILHLKPSTVKEMSSIFRFHGETEIMTEEETLHLFESCPDILWTDKGQIERQLTYMFGRTARLDLPWNAIFTANPELLIQDSQPFFEFLDKLRTYFIKKEDLYQLLENNPHVFHENFESVEKKIKFFMHEMNVSIARIARTRNSLMRPLDFYQTRYQFLLRSGLYKHPDPNQKGMRLAEAKPYFPNICDTSDSEFIRICAPTLSLEELNVLKNMMYLEKEDKRKIFTETDVLTDEDFERYEDENFHTYRKSKKNKKKHK